MYLSSEGGGIRLGMNARVHSFLSRKRAPLFQSDILQPQNVVHFFQEEENKIFKRRAEMESTKKDNAHVELQIPLTIGQVISLLPVYGISRPDPSYIHFRWRSLKVVYCFYVIFFQITFSILTLHHYSHGGLSYRSFGSDIIFYAGTTCMSLYFLHMARGWKAFIEYWVSVQEFMNGLKELSVRRKINIIVICLTISSVSEHILANSDFFMNILDSTKFQQYMKGRHSHVFTVFKYNIFFGIVMIFNNFIITMIWNFTDIFLTSVSLAHGKMYKQFTQDLEHSSKNISHDMSLSYWKKRREIYNKLALLTKFLDEKLSVLVLMSFGINLYYICIQLLHTMKPLTSVSSFIYFGGSFGHLLCRTCAVCFAASSIFENSKQPLSVIFSVPSDHYNVEVQRLQTQISSETLAFTGCNFFNVTRTLMLTIAGTIVTYEIVLVQFDALNNIDESSNNANSTT